MLEAPARARAQVGRVEVARVRFTSIQVGDRIDVGALAPVGGPGHTRVGWWPRRCCGSPSRSSARR